MWIVDIYQQACHNSSNHINDYEFYILLQQIILEQQKLHFHISHMKFLEKLSSSFMYVGYLIFPEVFVMMSFFTHIFMQPNEFWSCRYPLEDENFLFSYVACMRIIYMTFVIFKKMFFLIFNFVIIFLISIIQLHEH